MNNAAAAAARGPNDSSNSNNNSNNSNNDLDEEALRKQLREQLQKLTRREPLETTYKYLLMGGIVTPRKPTLPRDKLYKPITGRLRERVEAFAQHHHLWDRVAQREDLDETSMRAALTLREGKKHEQEGLLRATLTMLSKRSINEDLRKEHLDGMALGLQQKELKLMRAKEDAQQVQQKKKHMAELERKRIEEQRRRNREEVRRRHLKQKQDEEEERQRRIQRQENTPQQRLVRYIKPVFQKLWEMEFANLGNTNPFRIVIDKTNCASMGVPDYCNIVKKPMNLTYIKEKMEKAQYESLQQFFSDVDLMINNALLYNSDQNNDYHLAAKEMQHVFKKCAGAIVKKLKGMQKKK